MTQPEEPSHITAAHAAPRAGDGDGTSRWTRFRHIRVVVVATVRNYVAVIPSGNRGEDPQFPGQWIFLRTDTAKSALHVARQYMGLAPDRTAIPDCALDNCNLGSVPERRFGQRVNTVVYRINLEDIVNIESLNYLYPKIYKARWLPIEDLSTLQRGQVLGDDLALLNSKETESPTVRSGAIVPNRRAQTRRGILGASAFFMAAIAVALLALQGYESSVRHARILQLRGSGVSAALALFIALSYVILTWRRATAEHPLRGAPRSGEPPPDIVVEQAQKLKLAARSALDFYKIAIDSPPMFPRVTESITVSSPTTEITTTYTLALEYVGGASKNNIIPLTLVPKGALQDRLKIFANENRRLSSVPRSETLAYMYAVVDRLLTIAFELCPDQRDIQLNLPSEEGGNSLDHRSCIVESLRSPKPDGLPHVDKLLVKMKKIRSGEAGEALSLDSRWCVGAALNILVTMRSFYPICIAADQLAGHESNHVRIRVERRIHLSYPKSGISDLLRQPRDWVPRMRGLLGEFLGITPSTVLFPISSADRCGSYHVEVEGPEGTYLARQQITNLWGNQMIPNNDTSYELKPRRGQRFAHLYVRNANGFGNKYLDLAFYERLPGSVATATLSALAAAIIVLFCAIIKLGIVRGDSDGSVHGDIFVVLLTFPAIISAWAGFDTKGSDGTSTAIARIMTLTTVVVSIAAALWFLTTGSFDVQACVLPARSMSTASCQMFGHSVNIVDRPHFFAWIVIVSAIFINAIMAVGSWLLRAFVQRHFMARQDELLDIAYTKDQST